MALNHEGGTTRRKSGYAWEPKYSSKESENSKQRLSSKSLSFGGGKSDKNPPQEYYKMQIEASAQTLPSPPNQLAYYNTANYHRSRSSNAEPVPIETPTNSNKQRINSVHYGLSSKTKETKQRRRKSLEKTEKKTMIDASTQTTTDVGTQTSDDETLVKKHNEVVPGKKTQMKDASTSIHFPSIESFPLSPTSRRHKPKAPELERKKSELTIHSIQDDDLETEISRIRYRRLSIEEAMNWLSKEKTERPPNPVPIQIPDEDLIPTRDVPVLSSSYTRSSNMDSLAANILLKGRPKSTTPEDNDDDDDKRSFKSKLEEDLNRDFREDILIKPMSYSFDVLPVLPPKELVKPTALKPKIELIPSPDPSKSTVVIGTASSAFSGRLKITRQTKSMPNLAKAFPQNLNK